MPNGVEIKVRDYPPWGEPYVDVISDPFDDRAELYVYGYNPRVFNLMDNHVKGLTDDGKSVGSFSAE